MYVEKPLKANCKSHYDHKQYKGFTEAGICYTGPESPNWMFCAVTSNI